VYTGFLWANLRDRHHLKFPVVNGTIILKWIFQAVGWGMDLIDLA
jgi:hypothetical protein